MSFSTFLVAYISHVLNHTMVGLVITLYTGLSHSNLGQLKCVRPPGILGAISAIIIGYIISVYTPLQYHRVRTICSSPGIMYMRSLAPFGYICSMKSPQFVKYNIHINTRYELVNMIIYRVYNAF